MDSKKNGFCIIESLTYICIVSMLITVQIHVFLNLYKYYIDLEKTNLKYNNIQNFYLNLSKICSEEDTEIIETASDNSLYFYKSKDKKKYKRIKSYDNKLKIQYNLDSNKINVNTMLVDVENMTVKEKGNLIYMIIKDRNGKEFIRCMPRKVEAQS